VPWVLCQAVAQGRDPAPAMEQMHWLARASAHLLADDPQGRRHGTPAAYQPAAALLIFFFFPSLAEALEASSPWRFLTSGDA